VFRGVNALSLDAKARLVMPTRYRDRLRERCGGKLIITVDMNEPCLALYPQPEWEVIERKIDALPSFNPHTARVKRLLMGFATEVDMDGHGRILVPTKLRQRVNLDKQVVMIGQGKKFELWDEATWDTSCDKWLDEPVGEEMPAELASLAL